MEEAVSTVSWVPAVSIFVRTPREAPVVSGKVSNSIVPVGVSVWRGCGVRKVLTVFELVDVFRLSVIAPDSSDGAEWRVWSSVVDAEDREVVLCGCGASTSSVSHLSPLPAVGE
jgi:hypothetical protein